MKLIILSSRCTKITFLLISLAALILAGIAVAPKIAAAMPALLTPTLTATTTPTRTPTPTSTPTPSPTPTPPATNPAFEQIVNLGLPVGNAAAPQYLALDPATGLLYIFSAGLPILNQANSLTIYDTLLGSFTTQVVVNEAAHIPLDLQFDPTSGYLYALWEGQFGSDTPATLTIIDSQTLQIIEDIAGIQAMTVAEGVLYTIDQNNQLIAWAISPEGLGELSRMDLTVAGSERPKLAVNPAANRLYLALADGSGWRVEIFEADTPRFSQTGYPVQGQIFDLLPNPATGQLFVAESDGGTLFIHRLGTDGQQLDPRYRLDEGYGPVGMALSPDGAELYFSSRIPYLTANQERETEPGLIGLTLDEFLPNQTVPLLSSFTELVIDETTNRAFALYPGDNLLYIIDLDRETAQVANTAVEIRGVLADGEAGQIFVSDSANRVRRLDNADWTVLAETTLAGSAESYGFKRGLGAGELALDKTRNRLYVSGLPAYVLEADTLALIETVTPGGQFALAPGADKIYLSNCGVSILEARTLISETVIPGSARRGDQLGPDPCVGYSRLDPANQLLYSLASNNVPGSNSGTLLYVYDLIPEPTLVFTDTNISITGVRPDPANDRAFVSYARETDRQTRLLSVSLPAAVSYTERLSSLAGPMLYSPETKRLYVSASQRLLVLEADTLDVSGETPLPPDNAYRLAALDATNEKLYLAGFDGRLLIAGGRQTASRRENMVALAAAGAPLVPPAQPPGGPILALETLPDGDVLALINAGDDLFLDTHLFQTANQGLTWTDLSQNLPANLSAQDMVVSPHYAADQTLFLALDTLGETGGLYTSPDGGQTWTAAMTGLRDLSPNRLFLSPNFGTARAAGEALVLANTIHGGIHYSLDGGQTWQAQTSPPLTTTLLPSTVDSAAAVSDQDVVLISHLLGETAGVFRATVGPTGRLSAWRQVLDVPLTLLAFAPDGQTALGFGGALWRSDDAGLTWQPGGAGLTGLDDIKARRFLFSPDFAADQTVYLFFQDIRGDASGRLFRSTDAGETWRLWDNPPRSKRFTAVALTSAGDFLFGDDETQLTTVSPAAMTWAEPQPPADPFPLDDLAASPTYAQDQTLFAVSHAHGLFISEDGGRAWERLDFPVRSISLDSYRLAISPNYAADQTLYITTGFSLHRSEDGGRSWTLLPAAAGRPGFQAKEIALSPNFAADETVLAGGSDAIFRSTDGGDTWRQVLVRAETAGPARVLLFAPTGAAYAWFDYDSTFYTSADGGRRWQETPGPPEEPFAVLTAAVSPAETLMLRPDFYPQLFRVSDAGQSREALTGVLPDDLGDVQTMAYTPAGGLLVGGRGGLFRSADDGQTWRSLNGDLPAELTVTRVRQADDRLFVVLNDGRIFTTSDGGASWRDVSVVR